MSNEIQYRSNLTIRKRASDGTLLINDSIDLSFNDDMSGNKGPTPGALLIPVGGVVIDLSQLTVPGWAIFKHQGRPDGTFQAGDYVEIGIRDPDTNRFYPLAEIKVVAGKVSAQGFPIPLSRNILERYEGTGTGTTGATNQLFLKAHPVAQNVAVKVYEA